MQFFKDWLIWHLQYLWNPLAVDEVILVKIHGVRLPWPQELYSNANVWALSLTSFNWTNLVSGALTAVLKMMSSFATHRVRRPWPQEIYSVSMTWTLTYYSRDERTSDLLLQSWRWCHPMRRIKKTMNSRVKLCVSVMTLHLLLWRWMNDGLFTTVLNVTSQLEPLNIEDLKVAITSRVSTVCDTSTGPK